jgi:hypothetical protein
MRGINEWGKESSTLNKKEKNQEEKLKLFGLCVQCQKVNFM